MVAVITLPTAPIFVVGSPRLSSYGVDQKSQMGGATQRILRLGSRFAIDVAYPPMAYSDAQTFISMLVQSEGTAVAVPFPQRGLTIGTPGSFVVNGAANAGQSLAVRGGAANYVFQTGQFFSVITGGRRSLYMCTAQTTMSGTGTGTIPIAPIIRTTPSDGDTVEVAQPYLEGFVPMSAAKWSIEMLKRVGIAFTVEEDR
jgi:hypothetical protein